MPSEEQIVMCVCLRILSFRCGYVVDAGREMLMTQIESMVHMQLALLEPGVLGALGPDGGSAGAGVPCMRTGRYETTNRSVIILGLRKNVYSFRDPEQKSEIITEKCESEPTNFRALQYGVGHRLQVLLVVRN